MIVQLTLVEEIEKAFQNVTLENGMSLEQSEITDRYCEGVTEEEYRSIPFNEVTNDWKDIPNKALDNAECIAHLNAKGFRYYIPALMIHLINNYDPCSMMVIGTIGSLYYKQDSHQYYLEKFSLLNEAQCIVIAKYLRCLPSLIELDNDDIKRVGRAYKNYWCKYETANKSFKQGK